MENTIENKEKFFAQYWGQEIRFECLQGQVPRKNNPHKIKSVSNIENDYLELTPLSLITKEDIIKVGFILNDPVNDFDAEYIKRDILNDSMDMTGVTYDALRSLGYALPWNDLSVEDQIKYGWIKLKQ